MLAGILLQLKSSITSKINLYKFTTRIDNRHIKPPNLVFGDNGNLIIRFVKGNEINLVWRLGRLLLTKRGNSDLHFHTFFSKGLKNYI